jgi:hypothetical protein
MVKGGEPVVTGQADKNKGASSGICYNSRDCYKQKD